MAASKKRKKLPWVAGAVALGVGATVAAERILVGRARLRDPFANEPYGKLLPDRSYEDSGADGAVLYVAEMGPAESSRGAIFLHGYCLDHSIWHHQMLDTRRNDLRLVFYDARHHGHSRAGEEPSDVSLLARDLRAVIERSGLTEIVLVGHSMGGMAVLEFCRQFPEEVGARIAGIILVNTTYTDALKTVVAAEIVGPIERAFGKVIERVLDDPRSSNLMRLRGDDLSFWLVRLFGFGKGSSAVQTEYVRRLLGVFPSPSLIDMLRGIRKFDMEDALQQIDVPALIIAGGDDRVTTVRASEEMAEQMKDARLMVFEGAGHMTMMERNVEFNEALTDFLDQVFGTETVRRLKRA